MGDTRAVALLVGLAVLLGVVGLWAFCRWRVRSLTARMELRLLERQHELASVCDGLLQNLQGLTLKLQAVVEQLPSDEPARQALEEALAGADKIVVAGRAHVRNMRMAAGGEPHNEAPKA